jgi:CheY-like chemotaxis protein
MVIRSGWKKETDFIPPKISDQGPRCFPHDCGKLRDKLKFISFTDFFHEGDITGAIFLMSIVPIQGVLKNSTQIPMKNKNTVRILLADDDVIDRELFIEAMKATGINFMVEEVKNGQEVLDHLKSCKHFPDLIFLDLNMPVVDGREALVQIKTSDKYKVIPVFVLSTSSSQHDVFESYHAGANLFLVKPPSYDALVEILKNVLQLYQGSLATVAMV